MSQREVEKQEQNVQNFEFLLRNYELTDDNYAIILEEKNKAVNRLFISIGKYFI